MGNTGSIGEGIMLDSFSVKDVLRDTPKTLVVYLVSNEAQDLT